MNLLRGKKLLSVFPPQAWSLLVRVVPLGVVAFIAHYSPTWWWAAVYIGLGIYLYSYAASGARIGWLFSGTLVVLWAVAVIAPLSGFALVGATLLALALVYGLSASAMHIIVRYAAWIVGAYYVVLVALAAYIMALPLQSGWGKMALVFIGQYVLTANVLRFSVGAWNKRLRVWTMVGSLLGAQIVWITSLLSVGPLYGATLVLVYWASYIEMASHYYKGTLTREKTKAIVQLCVGLSVFIGLVVWITW